MSFPAELSTFGLWIVGLALLAVAGGCIEALCSRRK